MRIPENYTESTREEIMSNFDGVVIKATADYIKDKPLFSRYAGWNFNGRVWFQNDKWNCEVWTYGSYCETISEDTLEELMTSVSNEYGYE